MVVKTQNGTLEGSNFPQATSIVEQIATLDF